MTLNFHHLRLFQAIAREGGLTRAARRLNLSQSALSTQLQKLEAQLGHALFERQGKRLVLTEAGRIALEYADTAFEAGEALVNTLQERPHVSRRVLRIGAITTLSRNFQMEFLRPLVGRANVELVVASGTPRELLAQLDAQRLDVVLTNTAVRRDAGAALHARLLDQQPVSLVGRARPGDAPFRFPEGVRGQPVLLPGPGSDMRAAFDAMMELAGIQPRILAEVDDMAMLRLLARESDGLALVPPVVVRDELRTGALHEHCRIPGIVESFYALTGSRRFPNPLLAELFRA